MILHETRVIPSRLSRCLIICLMSMHISTRDDAWDGRDDAWDGCAHGYKSDSIPILGLTPQSQPRRLKKLACDTRLDGTQAQTQQPLRTGRGEKPPARACIGLPLSVLTQTARALPTGHMCAPRCSASTPPGATPAGRNGLSLSNCSLRSRRTPGPRRLKTPASDGCS